MDTTILQALGITTHLLVPQKLFTFFNSLINPFSHFLPLSILKKKNFYKNKIQNYNQKLYSLLNLCNHTKEFF